MMSRRALQVVSRLTVEKLAKAAREEREGRVRTRILAIRYLLQGHTVPQAAQVFALSESQLRMWVHRYNEEGLEGLRDRPRSGRPRKARTGSPRSPGQTH